MSASLRIGPGAPLVGSASVPGDKSIAHRALLLAALADGDSTLAGVPGGRDVASTAACLGRLGVRIEARGPGEVRVQGRAGRLREPEDVLDCGNSGTTARLLCGVLAAQPFHAVLTGDASLRARPMARVTRPLRRLGARIDGREGGRLLPLSVRGGRVHAGGLRSPVASAQVKSALILATLGGTGTLRYAEPVRSRDHTERMLRGMGVTVREEGGRIVVPGGQVPQAVERRIPGDPSSAAFLLAAAALVPGSDVEVAGVCLNPTRTGFLDALERMGAPLVRSGIREEAGEPVGSLRVRGAEALRGTAPDPAEVVRTIDELPLLGVLGAFADGVTEVRGAAELRVKETDRIAALVEGLAAIGARAEALPDGFRVWGGRPRGGRVRTHGDHRIAMAFAVAGLACPEGVELDDADCVDVSFPGFFGCLAALRGEDGA